MALILGQVNESTSGNATKSGTSLMHSSNKSNPITQSKVPNQTTSLHTDHRAKPYPHILALAFCHKPTTYWVWCGSSSFRKSLCKNVTDSTKWQGACGSNSSPASTENHLLEWAAVACTILPSHVPLFHLIYMLHMVRACTPSMSKPPLDIPLCFFLAP